jgi:hypothetical protein
MDLLARPIATGVLSRLGLRFAALISKAVRCQPAVAAARRASSGVLPLSPHGAFDFLIPIIQETSGAHKNILQFQSGFCRGHIN